MNAKNIFSKEYRINAFVRQLDGFENHQFNDLKDDLSFDPVVKDAQQATKELNDYRSGNGQGGALNALKDISDYEADQVGVYDDRERLYQGCDPVLVAKTLKWCAEDYYWSEIMEYAGLIGEDVMTAENIKKFKACAKKLLDNPDSQFMGACKYDPTDEEVMTGYMGMGGYFRH